MNSDMEVENGQYGNAADSYSTHCRRIPGR